MNRLNSLIGAMVVLLLVHSGQSEAVTIGGKKVRLNNLAPLVKDVDYSGTRINMGKDSINTDYYQFTLSTLTPMLQVVDITSNKIESLVFTLSHWNSAGQWHRSNLAELVPQAGCTGFTADTVCAIGDFSGSYVLTALATSSNNNAYKGGNYSFTLTAVPLPPAAILFGSVLFGLAVVGRRRNLNRKAAG